MGVAAVALLAMAAVERQADHDMIAGFYGVHFGTDLLDDPGGLVAKHCRQRERQVAGHDVQVRMAHADRLHPHENFTTNRLGDRDLLDRHGSTGLAEYRSLH